MGAPVMDRRTASLRAAAGATHPCVPAEDFAASMRKLASGIVVVTTEVEGRPWGLTLSSVSSFSADPARISLSVNKTNVTARYIAERERFGVAILSDDKMALAADLAAPGKPKFIAEEKLCSPGPRFSLPAIDGALYNIECAVVFMVEAVDHVLVVADVVSARAGAHAETAGPLTYFDRTFGSFAVGDPEGGIV